MERNLSKYFEEKFGRIKNKYYLCVTKEIEIK